jgi:energy-coupling factor transport system substrate-specific component
MSWQLASFVVLGAVLLGGFVWYERSRPPSQIVALVAALAALAVAGRLVLAAIPNVVATTDIVIFSGYALGAAPGFAVGALAGLISNFWLGQGPWTPWQMAGWGLAGVLGAALARATGRRAGRIELTLACGFAGIAYGALLNFSLMVSYGGEFTLDRWLTLEARAVPFDLAHAIGNVTLALVAGPAMVRMLMRFRERFEFRWRRAAEGGTKGPGARADSGWREVAASRLAPGCRKSRWGLLRHTGRGFEHSDDGLGDARPRGGRPQSARFARADTGHLPAPQRGRPARRDGPRSGDPRAAGRRGQHSPVRGPRPGGRAGSKAPSQRLV